MFKNIYEDETLYLMSVFCFFLFLKRAFEISLNLIIIFYIFFSPH